MACTVTQLNQFRVTIDLSYLFKVYLIIIMPFTTRSLKLFISLQILRLKFCTYASPSAVA